MGLSRQFNLSPGTTQGQPSLNFAPLDAALDFVCWSVVVDNDTPAWWYLPDSQHFIPPHCNNHVAKMSGVRSANVLYQSPPGITQAIAAPTAAGQVATFTFWEDDMPPASGYTGYSASGNESRRYDYGRFVQTTAFLELTLSTPAPNGILFEFFNIVNHFGAPVVGGIRITVQLPGAPATRDEGVYQFAVPDATFIIANDPDILLSRYYPAGTLIHISWAQSIDADLQMSY